MPLFVCLTNCINVQEAVGIDVQLLNDTQERILNVYKREPKETRMPQEENCLHLCASSLNGALYKATNHLLDDLHRNYRLLGTPERSVCAHCEVHVHKDGQCHLSPDAKCECVHAQGT